MKLKRTQRAFVASALAVGCASAAAGIPSSVTLSQRTLAESAYAVTPMPGSLLATLLFQGFDWGPWRDYALRNMTPGFGATFGVSYEPYVGLLHAETERILPWYADEWSEPLAPTLLFDLASTRGVDNPFAFDRDGDTAGLAFDLERRLFASGYSQPIGDVATFDVSAVLAYQQFSTWGFGAREATDVLPATYWEKQPVDDATGAGVRLGLRSELAAGLSFNAMYQSRINMDTFSNYRGVYSEPGDFDIPASATVGVIMRASARTALHLDVQRVMYSDINAVTSALLPDRFLSLLGDGGSPQFDWQDLTVYSVGASFAPNRETIVRVNYSTRQQPLPSADSLSRALASEFSGGNMSVGISRAVEGFGRFHVSASYAPAEYLLGAASYGRTSDVEDEQIEIEALWTLAF